jgi:hypothetical protein
MGGAAAGRAPEFRALVERFVAGDAGLEELRATLDRRTRREWDALGLRGVSGAMLLNQLVRRAPELSPLEHALAPRSVGRPARRRRVRSSTHSSARWARSAARAPCSSPASPGTRRTPSTGPGYHPSARQALAVEDALFVATGHAAADYLAFRHVFLALARAVGASPGELEFLCWWHLRRTPTWDPPEADDERPADLPAARARPSRRRRAAPPPARLGGYPLQGPPARAVVRERAPADAPVAAEVLARRRCGPRIQADAPPPDHTHVQWTLAALGRSLGCQVWVAANDRARAWAGEPLGALSVDGCRRSASTRHRSGSCG